MNNNVTDNIIKPNAAVSGKSVLGKSLTARTTNLRREYRNESLYEVLENSSINEENVDFDEDILRSAEMDKLFNILLKLKNVLTFTSDKKANYDSHAFVNYVNAKYTFSEVSNLKGKSICDSNVGNLAIRCKKYDKAIFHLIESLPVEKKNLKYKDFKITDSLSGYINSLRRTNSIAKQSKLKSQSSLNMSSQLSLVKESDIHLLLDHIMKK